MFGGDGLITRADQAALSAELSTYKEQLDLYKAGKFMENDEFVAETLTAGKVNLSYNTQTEGESGNIKTIIPSISDEYFEKLEVIKGELLLTSQDMTEIRVAQSLGIEVNPYLIVDGVLLSADTNLLLMDESTGSLTIPDSVTAIGEGAFADLSGLKTIIKVETIDQYIFHSCANLEIVNFQEGLKNINYGAFMNCRNLDNVAIPSSTQTISSGAFSGCNGLANIDTSKSDYYEYDANSGLLMTNDKTSIIFVSSSIVSTNNTFEIPEGVTSFNVLLTSYSNITKIIIPSSLQSIESAYIFPTSLSSIEVNVDNNFFIVENDCLYTIDKKELVVCFTKNETVELSDRLETIRVYAFRPALNITDLTLPDSVLSISGQVFNTNTKLQNLNIGSKVSYIAPLFKYNNYSGTVTIDEDNPYYTVENNILYNKDKTEIITVLYEINGEFTVNDSVTKIGSQAFRVQSQMTEIKLTDKITEIGSNAFSECDGLTAIFIPSSVETIGANAFSDANNLKSIQIDKTEGGIIGSPWGAIIGDRAIEWLG